MNALAAARFAVTGTGPQLARSRWSSGSPQRLRVLIGDDGLVDQTDDHTIPIAAKHSRASASAVQIPVTKALARSLTSPTNAIARASTGRLRSASPVFVIGFTR